MDNQITTAFWILSLVIVLFIIIINATRYLFQDEPTEVVAFCANNGEKRFEEVDEMTSAILRFRQVNLSCWWLVVGGCWLLVIFNARCPMPNAQCPSRHKLLTTAKGSSNILCKVEIRVVIFIFKKF